MLSQRAVKPKPTNQPTNQSFSWSVADKSPSCQDGTNLHQYSGKVSVTDGARTCQQWSEQAPHAHPFNTSEFFPLDDSVEGAVNYCRNVGGDGAPWCFTTDPRVRWQYCYEQICNGMVLDLKSIFFYLQSSLDISKSKFIPNY